MEEAESLFSDVKTEGQRHQTTSLSYIKTWRGWDVDWGLSDSRPWVSTPYKLQWHPNGSSCHLFYSFPKSTLLLEVSISTMKFWPRLSMWNSIAAPQCLQNKAQILQQAYNWCGHFIHLWILPPFFPMIAQCFLFWENTMLAYLPTGCTSRQSLYLGCPALISVMPSAQPPRYVLLNPPAVQAEFS